MTTVLAFLFTLAVLIAVHEWGHYRMAVACNVKVLRFSIGFGRVVYSRRIGRDGCEFALSAIPLGGYVRMLDEREGSVNAAERLRAFNQRPLWQRSAIVAAGPGANFILAVCLYACVNWIGMQEPRAVLGSPAAGSPAERAGLRAGDWVRESSRAGGPWVELRSRTELRWHLAQAALAGESVDLRISDRAGRGLRTVRLPTDRVAGEGASDHEPSALDRLGLGPPYSEPVLGEVRAGGPAQRAGLRQGDRVLKFGEQAVPDAHWLRQRIRESVRQGAGVPVEWTVERGERLLRLEVLPRVQRTQGGAGGPAEVGRIDAFVGQAPETVLVRRGVIEGIVVGAERTWEVATLTLRTLGKMLVGEASIRHLSGPLTIADFAGQTAERGLVHFLGFLALVSVSLGVLNLLPLPMLDGGHLLYHAFEAVTGRPVPDPWLERLQRGGMALLLVMMSVALYNDVARLLGFH